MKYFALLTKLGENLIAQATALGTKIELTHMAVGDGGGSLPTPDTNQTKLIAEKRRAAINTLFIDEKNKNQIIAEQIIPESEGGWWIREIGLFDKAGNLIAVANCPETYKPQLTEGSGRTQSIRMVLIVSHTESVTLKIDPSVVLATREYVNTEITVLDKKIDALSAQTKLDLSKKLDKSNISDVKGNARDKVPSLDLFTTETGKLATKAELTSGLAGKQPAGDYVSTQTFNDGLDKKFDKTGGILKGVLSAEGNIFSRGDIAADKSVAAVVPNGVGAMLDATGDKPALKSRESSALGWKTHSFQNKSGTLMHVGDAGWGGDSLIIPTGADLSTYSEINQNINAIYTLAGDYIGGPKKSLAGLLIVLCRKKGYSHDEITHIIIEDNIEYSRSKRAGVWNPKWDEKYSTKNTVIDKSGYLRVASSSDELIGVPIGGSVIWSGEWDLNHPRAEYFWLNEGRSFSAALYPEAAKIFPNLKLPDDRGYAIRIADNGRGIDPGRKVGTYQEDAMMNITGELGSVQLRRTPAEMSGILSYTDDGQRGNNNAGGDVVAKIKIDASTQVRTANEFRMKNVAKILITRMK